MLTRDYINAVNRLMNQTSGHSVQCFPTTKREGDDMDDREIDKDELEDIVDEACTDVKKTYRLADEVWHAAVQVFQLAMFTQQDVSDVFQSLEVERTDASTDHTPPTLTLTQASRDALVKHIERASETMPVVVETIDRAPTLPSNEGEPVFRISLVKDDVN
jgi:hypothetical protein